MINIEVVSRGTGFSLVLSSFFGLILLNSVLKNFFKDYFTDAVIILTELCLILGAFWLRDYERNYVGEVSIEVITIVLNLAGSLVLSLIFV